METPPPIPRYQDIADAEHLRLLSIAHYVLAGLVALGACLPLLHVAMGVMIVSGAMPAGGSNPDEARAFGWMFLISGLLFSIVGWIIATLMFLTARMLAARKNRTFCFVIGCIECVIAPLGTALGIFTLIVLLRPSVRALFDAPGAPRDWSHT